MTALSLGPENAAKPGKARAWSDRDAFLVLILGCLTASNLIMPPAYGLVAFHGHWDRMFKEPVLEHVAFNCLANLLVMFSALDIAGRFDQKLTLTFKRAVAVHGSLAFLTLISRHYYSIPMMLTGAFASAFLGASVVLARQRAVRPRVGILGPPHWIMGDAGLRCDLLSDPTAPVGPYQLILITFAGDLPSAWTQTLSRALLAGKPVRHVAEYLEELRGEVSADTFDLDHLPESAIAGYQTPKRLSDLICVAVMLPLALPIVAIAGLSVLATMGRPILFVQPRVGLGGRTFRMVKLRTMRSGPTDGEALATSRRDNRITPLGGWLRRFHIDELPQLWHVLIGDMSLIGPRPEQPVLAERYVGEAPAFAFRHLVRPGITGWAQVRAPYAADLAETRVKLAFDLFYLKNFSFGLDVQILARTFWTLASGGGVR